MSTKQRRNDMCNCGSKQKFKKCCLVHKQKPATVYHGHVAEQDKKYTFKHGKIYKLPDGKFLIACYHPSPRNVNTKIINVKMMKKLFIKAMKLALSSI